MVAIICPVRGALEPEVKANAVVNLATCPPEILSLDTNAEKLWPVLLRKVGVTVSRGESIEDKRAWILRNLGVDDLANRLSVQQKRECGGPQDDLARAMIWRHVAEASSPGDSIADLSTQNMCLLNPFIVPEGKHFPSPLALSASKKPEPESLVHRVLHAPECRTEQILVRLLNAALTVPAQPQEILRKRARKLLALMARRGDSAIPGNELDLVAWSVLSDADLARPLDEATEVTGAKQERNARRKTRHYKPCKQCGIRFLAKRTDQDFHAPKCGLRWRRNHTNDRRNCTEPSGTHINIGDNERVFAVPVETPVSSSISSSISLSAPL